ncbi:MAG TPA: helix-turn-helix transcriptional regulator [Steroidobacteraceae bacterium]|nr:helix-turn-helix transcriptional regulator [Steroidobacteraceae bacterium]
MNSHQLEQLAAQIKAAREAKGLSQRSVAEQVGIPQSHLSRIENGAVDLQTSSLLQIARVLDLELTLIPRNALPAIEALRIRRAVDETPAASRNRTRLNSLRAQATRIARKFPGVAVLTRLTQTILELRELPLELSAARSHQLLFTLEEIERLLRVLDSQSAATQLSVTSIKEIQSHLRELQSIGDTISHGQAEASVTPSPAYSLDNDENSNG